MKVEHKPVGPWKVVVSDEKSVTAMAECSCGRDFCWFVATGTVYNVNPSYKEEIDAEKA